MRSRTLRPFLALRLQLAALLFVSPRDGVAADGRIRHRLMFFEYGNCPNRFVELAADGTMIREFRPRSIAVIFQTLPNGNLVYAYGGKPTGVVEIDAHNQTVWNYTSHCPQVLGCERLANGNTLVAEQGPCQVVEVDHDGKVVHVTKLFTNQTAYHLQVRNIHRLENGDILAAHEGDGAIREYSPSGQIVWQYAGVENTGDGAAPAQWQHADRRRDAEAADRSLTRRENRLGVHRGRRAAAQPGLGVEHSDLEERQLPRRQFSPRTRGARAHAFEITRDKKVVWTFADHKRFKSVTTVRAIEDE